MGHTGMKPIKEKKQTCGKIVVLIAGMAGAVLPMAASADGGFHNSDKGAVERHAQQHVLHVLHG